MSSSGTSASGSERVADGGLQALAERVDVADGQREAGREGVAAEAVEQVRALRERVVDRDALDRARRALGRPAGPVGRQQDGRAVELLGDAARRDADDAGVPAGVVDDERDRVVVHEALGDDDGLVARGAVELAAAQVERLDVLDEAVRLGGVGRGEQLGGHRGVLDAAGGVDARPELEDDLGRRAARQVDAGLGRERREADAGRVAELLEAGPHEDAVLADHRHDVARRRDGDEVEVGPRLLLGQPERLERRPG